MSRNCATHMLFDPLDFTAQAAALVPKPRVNLTRCHGVFAPNNNQRARVRKPARGEGRAGEIMVY